MFSFLCFLCVARCRGLLFFYNTAMVMARSRRQKLMAHCKPRPGKRDGV